jgi:hypothetical protein
MLVIRRVADWPDVMRKAATLAVADVTAQRKTRKARLRERAGPVEAFGTLTARLKTAAR